MNRSSREVLLGMMVCLFVAAVVTGCRERVSSERGHIIAISPHVSQEDYRTEEAFAELMGGIVARALADVSEKEPKLMVFPEYVGTWLAVLGEDDAVFQAATIQDALTAAVTRSDNLGAVQAIAARVQAASPEDTLRKAFLLHKAPKSLQAYVDTFSQLAVKYNAYVVAGSILAPEFDVDNVGSVKPVGDKLYNISAVFDPRGRLIAKIKKIHLVPSEAGWVDAGSVADLRPVRTPFGSLGVMVCADGWYEDVYAAYRDVDVLVLPSFSEDVGAWDKPWRGGVGTANGDENLTEGQAWKKYALEGKIGLTRARVGVNVFMTGRLWEIETGGRSFIIYRGTAGEPTIVETPNIRKASSLRLELPVGS